MTEQEHTAGRDGDPRQSDGPADGNQGGSGQPERRHSWGSKAAGQGSRAANPRTGDDTRTGSADRTPDRDRAQTGESPRGSGSTGRPPSDRPAWKGQSDARGGSRSARPERAGQDDRRDRADRPREGRAGQARDGGGSEPWSDRRGQNPDRTAARSPERPTRGPDEGRGAQLRGSASRGGSSSGSAADRQPRTSGRGQAPTRRSDEGRDRPWQSRSSSGEGQSAGQRRSPERGNAYRRPSDRQERGAGSDRPGSDRHQGYGAEESAGPRPHNARDLRSANRPDRERSPEIDEDVKGDELDRVTRAQIRNLEERSALWVAKHLVMAGRLLDVDPELAFQHALAASRRGGRLAAVREAVGLTAYGAGHYGEALREFRTFRRISGSNVHLPVMADCERGLGRPDRALDLARSEEAESLDAAGKAELAMVVSGARSDLGQLEAAVAALEIPQLDLHRAFSFTPRLFRAYAAALDAAGRSGESEKWLRQARVAEKALGLNDDLEPDIIDLGEDDEPAPSPVPKVAEVLGAPAPAGAIADEPDRQERAGTAAHADEAASLFDAADAADVAIDADAEDAADATAGAEADAGEAAAVGPTEREQPSAGAAEDAEAVTVEHEAEVEHEHEHDVEHEAEDKREVDHEVASGPDRAPTEADEPAVNAGPVPVDAVPVGESAAAVQPLQTEMLFSMDDAGTDDLAASGTTGAEGAGTVVTPSTPVEFSAASEPAGPKDDVDD